MALRINKLEAQLADTKQDFQECRKQLRIACDELAEAQQVIKYAFNCLDSALGYEVPRDNELARSIMLLVQERDELAEPKKGEPVAWVKTIMGSREFMWDDHIDRELAKENGWMPLSVVKGK